MKFKHLVVACSAVSLLTVASCKKDEDEKTTAEKIQTKWGVESVSYTISFEGQTESENYGGQSGDYLDFRSDNKVYRSLNGEMDTLDYAIQSDTKLLFEGTPFDIQTLNDNTFKLYGKELIDPPNPSDYIEATFNLKK